MTDFLFGALSVFIAKALIQFFLKIRDTIDKARKYDSLKKAKEDKRKKEKAAKLLAQQEIEKKQQLKNVIYKFGT